MDAAFKMLTICIVAQIVGVLSCDSSEEGGEAGAAAAGPGGQTSASTGVGAGGGGGATVGELCNGIDDDGDGAIDEGLEADCGGCGRPYDRAVETSYPIHATWMFGRNSACEWQDALESFHRQGGKAVWQFAPHFEVHSAEELRNHPEFASCVEGNQHCVDAAFADLAAADPGNTVANILTYEFREDYSDAILSCPQLDRKVVVGERSYWRLVLPHAANQQACAFDGGSYDLLFVWFEGFEPKESLLTTADGMGMDVYLGMPMAQPSASQPWTVDLQLRPAYLEWARRVLTDYQSRHGHHPSFVGVYQSFELSMVSSGFDSILDTYELTADMVHGLLPSRSFALSPYWDVNKLQLDHTLASVKEGFKRLARRGADIIAPQDGRGTGKAALFWPYQTTEAIQSVDPKLATFPNVDGTMTYGDHFHASTRELFEAMRQAVDELKGENVSVELWANIEAFEYLQNAPCAFSWAFERTDKARMDWALTHAGAQTTRIISFMWDGYYTCTDGGFSMPLSEEIVNDGARPIASHARIEGSELIVRGYNLDSTGTAFELTWYDGSWAAHTETVSPSSVDAAWGSQNERMPQLQEARMPFDSSNLAPSFYLHIRPIGPGNLQAYHRYSLAY